MVPINTILPQFFLMLAPLHKEIKWCQFTPFDRGRIHEKLKKKLPNKQQNSTSIKRDIHVKLKKKNYNQQKNSTEVKWCQIRLPSHSTSNLTFNDVNWHYLIVVEFMYNFRRRNFF